MVPGSCLWSWSWSLGFARGHNGVSLVVSLVVAWVLLVVFPHGHWVLLIVLLVVMAESCSWSWQSLARCHGVVSLVVSLVVAWVLLVVLASRLCLTVVMT